MRHRFTAKLTLYYNNFLLSLFSQIIMVILLAECPKKYGKNKRTILPPNNY